MVKLVVPALVVTVLASGATLAAPRYEAAVSGPSSTRSATAVRAVPSPAAARPARVAARPVPPGGARGWFTVAENPHGEVAVKADSFTLGTDAAQAPVIMATLRLLNRATQEVLVKEAVVGLGDCESGSGTLYLANLTDLELFSRWEFAFGAGNIASSAAEALCGVAAQGIADATRAAGRAPDGVPGPAPAPGQSPAPAPSLSRHQPDPNET